jgi:transcription factor IIIB subunit 2
MSLFCPACGSRDIELHEAAGHAACVECGTLIEENAIVSSIEFQETGDRSHVVGQFVTANTANKPFSASSRTRGRSDLLHAFQFNY